MTLLTGPVSNTGWPRTDLVPHYRVGNPAPVGPAALQNIRRRHTRRPGHALPEPPTLATSVAESRSSHALPERRSKHARTAQLSSFALQEWRQLRHEVDQRHRFLTMWAEPTYSHVVAKAVAVITSLRPEGASLASRAGIHGGGPPPVNSAEHRRKRWWRR